MNTNEERLKNSNIPFINLSKENLILIYDSLEAGQAGNMLFKLTEYLYQGIEPSFETKIENIVWNNIMLLINRKAEGYFVKASVARENGKKGGRPKKSELQEVTTTEFDNPKVEDDIENANKADLSHSKPSMDAEYHQQVESGSNRLKTVKKDEIEINNNTDDNMGTLTNIIQKKDGKFEKIEESNNKTITNDFSAIDRLIPMMNKEMALKQVKPYNSREKNIGRLNDALSVFLNGVTLDDKAKYYNFLLEQSFAVA